MLRLLTQALQFTNLTSRTQRILVLIIASAVVLRIYFALATPEYMDEVFGRIHPFNDEYAHHQYTLYLIEHHRLPVNTKIVDLQDPIAWIFQEFEYTQPPLYYILNIPFALLPKPILFCRLFSVLLSSLTLILGVSVTTSLFKQRDLAAIVAAIFLGFHPILLRIGASIGNDNLAWLLSMMLMVLYLNGGVWKRPWITGLLLGFALLTKVSFLIWIIFLFTVGLLSRDRDRLMKVLGMVLIAALVSGWWFVKNYHNPRK